VTERSSQVAQAVVWCGLSVAWAAIAGAISLIAGLVAGSIALIGFGADSLVDGSASAMLVWRFRAEGSEADHAEKVERQAARAVGLILMLIAFYLTSRPSWHSRTAPARRRLSSGSFCRLRPCLSCRSLVEPSSGSPSRSASSALHGDGVLSWAGAGLAGATLLSLFASSAFG
jgi:hypothetical protein